MTFDNIPFVITLKKNEHYFPTMEFIKDPQEECGWSIKTYEKGKIVKGRNTAFPFKLHWYMRTLFYKLLKSECGSPTASTGALHAF